MVKVLVANEHSLICEGLCALLKDCEEIQIVGKATNGQEIIEIVREQTPDIVLISVALSIGNGAGITNRIRQESSHTKMLLVTQYEDRNHVLSGLRAGASGCIPMRATASDLVSAILTVYRGGCFLYPSVARTMVDDYLCLIGRTGSRDPYSKLTGREREVLKLIAEGRRSGEIANFLGITPKTVLGHRTSIMRKLGSHNWTDLIKCAVRQHLVTIDE